ncbi:hypothetical protein NPX13_g6698 [Xylaria arbuscula]|uniref:Uncharacterized protein n=1 Tax=Xylaria arbuscula TaxID=114810 RepID=A0A9W8NC28_9PEZI|nr:hypothetical protein NPX13_g6698 [Xylaria arbuscula]
MWNTCELLAAKEESDFYQSMFRSWKLAFNDLTPNVQTLLFICSALDCRDIWFDLLKPRGASADLVDGLLPDIVAFEKFLAELDNASQARVPVPRKQHGVSYKLRGFSIHPIFEKMLHLLVNDDRGKTVNYINAAIRVVGRSIFSLTPSQYSSRVVRYLPHAVSCFNGVLKLQAEGIEIEESTWPFLEQVGRIFIDCGSLRRANLFYGEARKAIEGRKKVSKQQKQWYYVILNSQGTLYTDEGDFEKAWENFRLVLQYIKRRQFPAAECGSYKATVLANFAVSLRKDGRLQAAEKRFKQALKELDAPCAQGYWPRVRVCKIRHQLGVLYAHQKDLSRAQTALEEAKAEFNTLISHDGEGLAPAKRSRPYQLDFHNALDPQNMPYRYSVAQDLAAVYQERGEQRKAREELQEARDGLTKMFGAESPYVLNHTWHEIQIFEKQFLENVGQLDEAEKLHKDYDKLLELQRRCFGPDHFYTLRTIGTRGIFHYHLVGRFPGHVERAREDLQVAHQGLKHLPNTHDKARVMLYLAKVYGLEGREEASKAFDEVIDLCNARTGKSCREGLWVEIMTDAVFRRAVFLCQICDRANPAARQTLIRALQACKGSVRPWAEKELEKVYRESGRAV